MRLTSAVLPLILAISTSVPAAEPKTMRLDLGAGAKMDLVLVPAGEFMMGSPGSEKERQPCDGPTHKVRIARAFYMGKFEVTNAQYRAFRPAHDARYLEGDDRPAVFVSWYDADAFCRWLSAKLKRNVRLPTEAEWEYACRAGTTTRFHTGNHSGGVMRSTDLPKAAWYGANSQGRSHPVGKLAANAFGLHDMHGNAWEWCSDWFGADYYRKSPGADPAGPAQGTARILRGGSWFYWTTYYCRSSHRYRYRPDARESVTGFRIVLDTLPYWPRPKLPRLLQPWPARREIKLAYKPADPKEARVAKAFGPPVVTVPKATPIVDGERDDAWDKASPFFLRFLSGRAAAPTAPTLTWVLCDDTSLYVYFVCADHDMKRLTVAGEKRDDPVWQGDTVEIFIDPTHSEKTSDYYHIAINPAGVTMDTKGGDKGWDPKLRVKTGRSGVGWSVEAAIPLAELGIEAGQIPTVIGLNLTRYRPEIAAGKPRLGTLVPHSWPVDHPEKLRFAEDTGWAPTLSDSSHWPSHFGHAILEVGTKKTPPPAKLFELIAREDFSSGKRGRFSTGEVVDGGFMGAGKALKVGKSGAALWQLPQTNFRDVQIIAAIKAVGGSGAYWHTFGRMYGNDKCCPRQVTTLTRDFATLAPTFNYCDGAGRIDWTSKGMADPYYAGYKKHLSWFSEPTIGRIFSGGPRHWAVAYTRVGDLQTQHPSNKRVNPEADRIRGWFLHPQGSGDILIGEAVMFRGLDVAPPARPAGLAAKRDGKSVVLSWKPAADNTLTVWYKVTGWRDGNAEFAAEVAGLSVKIDATKAKGMAFTVQAVDFFENVSQPSEPVAAE